jgi:agmatinase
MTVPFSLQNALRYRASCDGFLGLPDADAVPLAQARAVVIPFGLEATVCYGKGTSRGPDAILAASPFVEYFDEALWLEPFRQFGVATLEAQPVAPDLDRALRQIEDLVSAVLDMGKFPLVLGGEHLLTAGAIRPFAARFPRITVLQIDAHADLRDTFQGRRLSHATAMRRVLDFPNVSLVQAGIRSISASEIPFLEANTERVRTFWAKDKAKWSAQDIAGAVGPGPLYITFDVDGLDASLMAATGTPEPGGLFFDEACAILAAVSDTARVVGADLVELAPSPGLHACDFTAAKLAYKLLTAALARG